MTTKDKESRKKIKEYLDSLTKNQRIIFFAESTRFYKNLVKVYNSYRKGYKEKK
jgi:hypothetical protein